MKCISTTPISSTKFLTRRMAGQRSPYVSRKLLVPIPRYILPSSLVSRPGYPNVYGEETALTELDHWH
jgi:hypothetical protein